MERVVRREYTPAGQTIKTELVRTPEKKPKAGWLRVLAWQTAISLFLCLGAWGLGRWEPRAAEQVKSVLASGQEDPVSQAVRRLWEGVTAGEPVTKAVAEFYDEISNLP